MVPKTFIATVLLLADLGMTGGARAGSDVADAVMRRDAAALHELLARHADVNARQADGATALQFDPQAHAGPRARRAAARSHAAVDL